MADINQIRAGIIPVAMIEFIGLDQTGTEDAGESPFHVTVVVKKSRPSYEWRMF